MSNFQANNRYDHYNNNLTTRLLNHLTRSELIKMLQRGQVIQGNSKDITGENFYENVHCQFSAR